MRKKNSPRYGKGDWKRPVDEKRYSDNWDRIFNKDKGEVNETNTGTNSTPTK